MLYCFTAQAKTHTENIEAQEEKMQAFLVFTTFIAPSVCPSRIVF